MPFAIGLRFYRVTIRVRGKDEALPTGPGSEPCDILDYCEGFVERRTTPTQETSEPRTWLFERQETNSIRVVHGFINYGTHGFESKIKDVKTRTERYQRQATDLEEIPLYFQIWCPSDADCAIFAFQSFTGRSCVSYVRAAMIRDFQERFPGYLMRFSVLAPSDAALGDAPVKALTFLKPKRSSDRADRMLGHKPEEIDYQLTVRAKRRGAMLASFRELKDRLSGSANGLIEFDGHAFESVRAEVKFGRKRRIVGLAGTGFDAGLIDVTDEVKCGKNGHPMIESITAEVDDLMEEFYGSMKT